MNKNKKKDLIKKLIKFDAKNQIKYNFVSRISLRHQKTTIIKYTKAVSILQRDR